jgi:hypothetical protein
MRLGAEDDRAAEPALPARRPARPGGPGGEDTDYGDRNLLR